MFTTTPGPFLAALSVAENALRVVSNIVLTFGLAEPKESVDIKTLLLAAHIAQTEGKIVGILNELQPKPLKLKRDMLKLFDTIPDPVWSGMHGVITDAIAKFAPAAAKQPKVF